MTASRPAKPWRVYGSQPAPVVVATGRQARRLARRYARLGIRADLYVADGAGGWRSADGTRAHLNDEVPAARETTP